MKKYIILILILTSTIFSVDINIVKEDMTVLDFKEIEYSDEIKEYFDYYKLNFYNTKHYFGYFTEKDLKLSGHIWIPNKKDIKGTLFVQHGYLDNVGYMQKLIEYFLDLDFAIAAMDLPGHGLSSGEVSGIDSFATYGQVFTSFVNTYSKNLPRPYYAIGHSTGASTLIEYLYNTDSIFTKSYLISPLVRTTKWKTSKFLYYLSNPLLNRVNRIYRDSSHDESFSVFQKDEPLKIDSLAFSWSKALYKWEKEFKKRDILKEPVMIIQGDKDGVVWHKHNIPFLKEKIEGVEVRYIIGAEHALPNEIEKYRNKAFDYIKDDILKEK